MLLRLIAIRERNARIGDRGALGDGGALGDAGRAADGDGVGSGGSGRRRREKGSGGSSLTSGQETASPLVGASQLGVSGEEIVWTSRAPGATGEYGAGFDRTMSASGAWYDKLATLSAYYTSLAFNADAPTLDATVKTTDSDGAKKYVIPILWTDFARTMSLLVLCVACN